MSSEGYRKDVEKTSPLAKAIVAAIGLQLKHQAAALSLPERCYIAEKLMRFAEKLRGGKRGKL